MDYKILAKKEEKRFNEANTILLRAIRMINGATFGEIAYVCGLTIKHIFVEIIPYLIRWGLLRIIDFIIKPFHKKVSSAEYAECNYELFLEANSTQEKMFLRLKEKIPSYEQEALMRIFEA